MTQPVDKKLFIGNIKNLDIRVLMNTVKLIDNYAHFYPDANKRFGFIHSSTPEKCNEIFEKLLNSMYMGRHIIVERPKGYVEPKVVKPLITMSRLNTFGISTTDAWKKLDPDHAYKARLETHQMAINEAERIKKLADDELAEIVRMNEIKKLTDEMIQSSSDASEDAFVDSFFGMPSFVDDGIPKNQPMLKPRVIYNPEEMDW
jgi:hypothetical protein